MGIELKTPKNAIDAFFSQALIILREEIENTLSYLGEQSVKRVRDRVQEDSWFDQTGNLRSSIGYTVFEHGKKLIESAFSVVKNGSIGQSEGRKMVEELAGKYADTYALVVLAGMSYAEIVEALDSKDVLASTEIWARNKLDGYLEKTRQKALKRINAIKL